MHPALERFLQQFKATSDAIIDSWFVCDAERNIVDYNRIFYAMFPRHEARTLKGRKCADVLRLSICHSSCIAEQCWREKRHVRLDEITGQPLGHPDDQPQRHFVLSAIPILDDHGNSVGALEIQRDVTDEALVQDKYRRMLDNEARERERLMGQIRARTKELLDTNQLLLKVQKELVAYKRGLAL
ncbi:MAG: PAS domain-containing protein [Myxococcales bacterium]|nr:PAS domain-containing protein [Myxococcota bacterium]MDW8284002.1 PAS domain-containing protein [Myxococcales bacterium]